MNIKRIKRKLAAVISVAMIVSGSACDEVKKGSENTATTLPTSGGTPIATEKAEATPGITPYETLPSTPEETIAVSTNSTPDICGTSTVTSHIKPTVDSSATPSATPTPTVTPTEQATEKITDKPTPTPIVKATATVKPTPTPTMKPTSTVKPTTTPTVKPTTTVKPTPTPTVKSTDTVKPTTPTPTVTVAPTKAPLVLTDQDHERVINECDSYATSFSLRGFNFNWTESMQFETADFYEGFVYVNDYNTVAEVIAAVQAKIALIPDLAVKNVKSTFISYKIEKISIGSEEAYVILYGKFIPLKPTPTPYYPEPTDYDIEYWVKYAQDYARSLGMRVYDYNPDYPPSWDTPINITPRFFDKLGDTYFVKDIEGYLDDYSKGISLMGKPLTSTAIWYEWDTVYGKYKLYIGH